MTTHLERQPVAVQDADGRIHHPDDLTYIYEGTETVIARYPDGSPAVLGEDWSPDA